MNESDYRAGWNAALDAVIAEAEGHMSNSTWIDLIAFMRQIAQKELAA